MGNISWRSQVSEDTDSSLNDEDAGKDYFTGRFQCVYSFLKNVNFYCLSFSKTYSGLCLSLLFGSFCIKLTPWQNEMQGTFLLGFLCCVALCKVLICSSKAMGGPGSQWLHCRPHSFLSKVPSLTYRL